MTAMSLMTNPPRFEPTISLGNLIAIASIVVGIFTQWGMRAGEQGRVEQTLVDIQQQVETTRQDHDKLIQLAADVRRLLDERKLP